MDGQPETVTIPELRELRRALKQLSRKERRRVRIAVSTGKPISDDKRLAALAIGYARWVLTVPDRSRFRMLGILWLGFTAGLGWVVAIFAFTLFMNAQRWSVGVSMLAVAFVGLWVGGRVAQREAAKAETGNLAVLEIERRASPTTSTTTTSVDRA